MRYGKIDFSGLPTPTKTPLKPRPVHRAGDYHCVGRQYSRILIVAVIYDSFIDIRGLRPAIS